MEEPSDQLTVEPTCLKPASCIIICAFIASGKTWFTTKPKPLGLSEYKDLDLDSSMIPKENGRRASNFKELYLAMMKNLMSPNTILLISTHKEMRSALVKEGFNYALVYPRRELQEEWMERLESRRSPEDLIKLVREDWSSMLGECEEQDGCTHVTLNNGQYLSDRIEMIVKQMIPVAGACRKTYMIALSSFSERVLFLGGPLISQYKLLSATLLTYAGGGKGYLEIGPEMGAEYYNVQNVLVIACILYLFPFTKHFRSLNICQMHIIFRFNHKLCASSCLCPFVI